MECQEKYWCAFSALKNSSSVFVNKLYSYFGSASEAWNADDYDIRNITGVKQSSIKDFLEERKRINPDKCLEYINKRKIKFIHPESPDYPCMLKHIYNPPAGLFVLGSLSDCNLERTLAVVGSRKASENAKSALRKILEGFSNTDICIVSGMAEGIDTVAHKTAVENNIKTIAVLGGGFDRLYPKSNTGLFNKIIKDGGAVITEYWPDTEAISWHFPVRNRIVSGLSKGVLVAEAALKSGAMITAELALEQNKELMCMPGLISNPNTEGIYSLLKTGAGLVTETEDIINCLNWQISSSSKTESAKNNLTKKEELVLEYLKKDSLTTDELAYKTSADISELMVTLTKLELNGIIKQGTGEKYTIL